MNKPVYLGLSILKIRKTVLHVFWYGQVNFKYGKQGKLCYMDSFVVNIQTEDIYIDITKDAETRIYIWNYEIDRPLHKRRKVTGWMKTELGRKIISEFVGLRPKAYSYLIYDGDEKGRDTK